MANRLDFDEDLDYDPYPDIFYCPTRLTSLSRRISSCQLDFSEFLLQRQTESFQLNHMKAKHCHVE